MGGGSPHPPFLLPAFAGGYESKEKGILPDATCIRQAAQVQSRAMRGGLPLRLSSPRRRRIQIREAHRYAPIRLGLPTAASIRATRLGLSGPRSAAARHSRSSVRFLTPRTIVATPGM